MWSGIVIGGRYRFFQPTLLDGVLRSIHRRDRAAGTPRASYLYNRFRRGVRSLAPQQRHREY
jgi:hypothetical protein